MDKHFYNKITHMHPNIILLICSLKEITTLIPYGKMRMGEIPQMEREIRNTSKIFVRKLGVRVGRPKHKTKDNIKIFKYCDVRMWIDLVASLQRCNRVPKYCRAFNK
jgi:hypothetical protein